MSPAPAATLPRARTIALVVVLAAVTLATGAAAAQARKAQARTTHAGAAHAHGTRASRAHARGAHARPLHVRSTHTRTVNGNPCAPARAATHPKACAQARRRARRAAEHRRLLAERRQHREELERARHTLLPPVCEDGSKPSTTEDEQTCADGSEPQCPDGTITRETNKGVILYCLAQKEPSTPFSEEACEPGAAQDACGTLVSGEHPTPACPGGANATATGETEFTCPDGSEPHCEAGFQLTLSEDGSELVCEAIEDPAASPEGS